MPDKLQVENEPFLERDLHSNAIINRDSNAYAMVVKNREITLEKERYLKSLEQDVADLKQMVADLLAAKGQP